MRCGIDGEFAGIVSIIAALLTDGGCVPDVSLERGPRGNSQANDELQLSSNVAVGRRVMRPLVEYGPGFSKSEVKPFDRGRAVNKLKNLFYLKWKLYEKPKKKKTTGKPSTTTTTTTTTTTKQTTTTSKPPTTTTKPSTTTTRPSSTTVKTTAKSQPTTTKSKPLTTTSKPTTTKSNINNKTVTPVQVIVNKQKNKKI